MILLKNSNGIGINFETTIFPDGTSQVWKLEEELLTNKMFITWVWEGKEAELFHLCQLVTLIKTKQSLLSSCEINLYTPYTPYARQDKKISNTSTFALEPYLDILAGLELDSISGFDTHSSIYGYKNINPLDFQMYAIEKFKPDVIMFPDKGAYNRYDIKSGHPIIVGEKIREQISGKIIEYKMTFPKDYVRLNDKRILIIDDLCDAGGTFVLAAKELKEYNVSEIGLCVSHGIFSKGFEEMQAAGISQFFYTNSLLKNKDGYKVWV